MIRLLFMVAAIMTVAMVFGPLRRHILRRLDITATILLIVVPLMAAGRLFYTVRQGGRDDIAVAVLVVGALIALWMGLWWLTNTLERRRPTRGAGLPISPARIAQRWMGLPAVPMADVESAGVGLARFTGRLWGRTRARRGPGKRTASPAAARAPAPASATTPANGSRQTTGSHRRSTPARQSTTRRRKTTRRAAPSSQMDSAAMTLGRLGGNLFGRARKATRPKPSSPRRRRK